MTASVVSLRPNWRAIKLPNGRVVTFAAYVAAFRQVKALAAENPSAYVRGWGLFPQPAGDVVREYQRAIDDRVNIRGGLVVRAATESKLLRLMRDRIKHDCRWCGQPLGMWRAEHARFCDSDCRRAHTS